MSILIEAWGPLASFNRPEMKTERVSYDIITPSAARGLIESCYWHPGLHYVIDRIYVLNPIRFTNIRRNEVREKLAALNALKIANGAAQTPYLVTSQAIQQRAALMLRDVHYVIEAHFDMTDQAAPGDNPGKFQDILKRRLRRGQCYSQPYFGCRECTAHIRLWEGGEIPAIAESRDLGWMLWDMDYRDPGNITPKFFRAQMVNGVVTVKDCEVVG